MRFLAKRTLFLAISLLLVSVIVFSIMEVIPGDIAQTILGRGATDAQVQALRVKLGLGEPAAQRYLHWLAGLVSGQLGQSLSLQTPIAPLLLRRAANSMLLAGIACGIGLPLSILLGFVAGWRRPPWIDQVLSKVAVIVGSLPEFLVAMLLVLLLSRALDWLPSTSLLLEGESPLQVPATLILPVLTLVVVMMAYNLRVTRASVVKVLQTEYVVAAELKHLPARTIVARHVAPNALLPTMTVAASYVGWMLGGLVVIEAAFTYPGVGLLILSAAKTKDVPLLEAAILLVAGFRMIVNLISDILYRLVDPRVRIS
jgi:peptide/nickel transport system permease protein